MKHRTTLPAMVAWLMVAAALIVGCGLSTDAKPRVIDHDQVRGLVDAPSSSTAAADQSGAQTVRLYFICAARIIEVPTKAQAADPRSVIELLLAGPTDSQRANGYTTYIPPGTRLLSLDLSSGVLVLQLSKDMDTLSGQSAKTAYAQLVFTATGTGDVTRVAFQTATSSLLAVPTDSVNKKVVSRADYDQAPSTATTSSPTSANACPPPVA